MRILLLTIALLGVASPAFAQAEPEPRASPVTLVRIGFRILEVTPVRTVAIPGRPGEQRVLNGMWLQKDNDLRYCEQLPGDADEPNWRCGTAR